MISRYFVSLNFAALITFGLFFAMQMLISNGETVLVDNKHRTVFRLPTVREATPLEPENPAPVRREVEPEPEDPFVKPTMPGVGNVGPTTSNEGVRIKPPKPGKGPSVFNNEGDFISIIRPAPQYPVRMAEQGIEGFVRLQYTINEMGKTEDVTVISSSHRGFETAARRAVEKFKFKPRVEDGVAIAVPNVYSTIEFTLTQ